VALAAGPAYNESDTPRRAHGYLGRLTGLATELDRHGLTTRLITPSGRIPSLHVVNPAVVRLAEDVYAGRSHDGAWWFWWPWAERIAPGDDLVAAAALIARVLSAQEAAR